jgi:hypothetical protein
MLGQECRKALSVCVCRWQRLASTVSSDATL